jgi:hypothetical protein
MTANAAAHPPAPLGAFDARGIVGVLTDIDDTLTTDGLLTPDAYSALCSLARAGIRVVPVTGRSAGWAHMVAKTWPVAAVVAESGGLYLYVDPADGRLHQRMHASAQRVNADRARLLACAQRVMAAVPGLAPASDNAYRLVDLALDYCEELPRVPAAEVERAITMFRDAGFSARASSVHVNAWAGAFDKAPTALACLAERFGDAGPEAIARWAFIGDAPNDASMFAAFPNSVGVANILPHLATLPRPPAYVTRGASGEGFVEFARHLLAARAAAA